MIHTLQEVLSQLVPMLGMNGWILVYVRLDVFDTPRILMRGRYTGVAPQGTCLLPIRWCWPLPAPSKTHTSTMAPATIPAIADVPNPFSLGQCETRPHDVVVLSDVTIVGLSAVKSTNDVPTTLTEKLPNTSRS